MLHIEVKVKFSSKPSTKTEVGLRKVEKKKKIISPSMIKQLQLPPPPWIMLGIQRVRNKVDILWNT